MSIATGSLNLPVKRRNKGDLHECKQDIQEAREAFKRAQVDIIDAATTLGRALRRAKLYCTDHIGFVEWMDYNFPGFKVGEAERFIKAADSVDVLKNHPQRRAIYDRIGTSVTQLATIKGKLDRGVDPLAPVVRVPYTDRLAALVKREKAVALKEKELAAREKAVSLKERVYK